MSADNGPSGCFNNGYTETNKSAAIGQSLNTAQGAESGLGGDVATQAQSLLERNEMSRNMIHPVATCMARLHYC